MCIRDRSNNATTDPNDQVIGIDFSGGMASVVTQLNTALGGANLTFSNPSGSVLRVLDDGAAGLSNVDAASVTATMTSLTSGNAELPFFTDGGQLSTGAMTAGGSQMTGFASRITVNSTLLGDPTRTVIFSTSPQTPSGDTTRPDFLYDKLVNGQYYYSPTSGIGTNATPFNGTIASSQMLTINGTVAGTGTIGNTNVNAGGTIAPGNGGIGTLSVQGNLAMVAGSRFAAQIDGTGASDRITVTGALMKVLEMMRKTGSR